jgi:DNA-binding transcriptional MerR regulator
MHYSLRQLAAEVGIEPRTIRSYIQQGLIRGPDGLGRGASYSDSHLLRLKAIRVMRDQDGLSIGEIRGLLLDMTNEEVEQCASRFDANDGLAEATSSSALHYLARVRESLGGEWSGNSLNTRKSQSPQRRSKRSLKIDGGSRPLERTIRSLEQTIGKPVPARSRGEGRFVIQVTPDIELHVRGRGDSGELTRFERLADCLREIIMGDNDGESEK